jgi:hypothetical protein
MFTNTMIFIIPVSLIALIPFTGMGDTSRLPYYAFIDLLSIAMIFIISFKKVEIENRKLLFIYDVLSCALMYLYGLGSNLCPFDLIYPFKSILSCFY